jgi:hypothetical protein
MINLSNKAKTIIGIVVGVVVIAGVIGGSIAIANAVKKNKQSKCEHVYDEGQITAEATCEDPGMIVYTCGECKYQLTEEIPANGHVESIIEAVPATCTAKGLTDGVKCVTCEEILVAPVETPMLGHKLETLKAVAATCTTTGKTEGANCSRCKAILKEQTVIPAKGHTVVEVKGVDATCTEVGKTSGSMCSACGKVYSTQEDVPALGHVDANSDGACDRCGYTNPDMMFSLFQKDETYTEQAVNVGEKIAGSYYRIYKDQGDPEESGYAYPNSIYVSWGDMQVKIGFGAATGQTATGSLDLYSKLVEANFIYRDYDDYVDFYIPAGNYQLGLGPYNKETCDPDGNGYFDLTIDSETTIAGVNGENKCFRLVLNSGV